MYRDPCDEWLDLINLKLTSPYYDKDDIEFSRPKIPLKSHNPNCSFKRFKPGENHDGKQKDGP